MCTYNSDLAVFIHPTLQDHYYSFHCAGDRWLRLLGKTTLNSNVRVTLSAVGASGLAATLHIGLTSAGQWGVFVEQWGDTNVWIHAPRPAGFASLTSALSTHPFASG